MNVQQVKRTSMEKADITKQLKAILILAVKAVWFVIKWTFLSTVVGSLFLAVSLLSGAGSDISREMNPRKRYQRW